MPAKPRDPAFLYYDGDVALDVAHMTREQKGCYLDLIQVYKRYHGFTMVQIRYLLGSDFDTCWNSIALVLELDGDKYHIPWLRKSLADKELRNKKQKENIQKRWNKPQNGISDVIPRYNDGITDVLPNDIIGTSNVIPKKETETETKDRLEEEEGGTGGDEGGREGIPGPSPPKGPPWPEHASGLPAAMVEIFVKSFPRYPQQADRDYAACLQIAYQIADQNGWPWQSCLNGRMEDVLAEWSAIVTWIPSNSWFRTKSITFLSDKFQDLIQAKNNGKADQKNNGTAKQAAGNGLDPTAISTTGFGKL